MHHLGEPGNQGLAGIVTDSTAVRATKKTPVCHLSAGIHLRAGPGTH